MRRGNKTPLQISSPCVRTCKIVDGFCVGCKRTGEEISKWSWIQESERLEIIEVLKFR